MRAGKFIFFTFFCIFGSSLADESTDAFTGDLLRAVFSQSNVQQNTVLSPVSLYDVTALLQQGSGGNSLEELTKVLHADAPTTRKRYADLIRSIKADHSETQLEFANKVYIENGFPIQESFRSVAVQDFQAGIENIEFKQAQQAADDINDWVSENTHGRIKDLVKSDSLTPDTAMVLLNAVFFAGNWTYQFEPYGTVDSSFTTLDRQTKSVSMMHLSETLMAGEIEELNAKFVRLPFRGDEFSMIIVVPNDVDGLSDLIDKLQEDHLASILASAERRNVDLSLPKFKFSTTSKLVPTLQKLGLNDIFTDASNLTGIASSPPLYVSDVTQKADIEVDERGATAAAATSVTGAGSGLPLNVLYIEANHPFMFFIVNDIDFLPIFSGWVGNP
ncbi:hypothetical protein L9F63_004114 [Diploptera punctata]|uniref:Serpin domain-containing protein n=1 Tax=Diploptera punctata TaxID=6984 RepID=A0AAD8E7Z5_DIPPU|nr:hypothetical protein L9F63_004114 [Diploptera punctata]